MKVITEGGSAVTDTYQEYQKHMGPRGRERNVDNPPTLDEGVEAEARRSGPFRWLLRTCDGPGCRGQSPQECAGKVQTGPNK